MSSIHRDFAHIHSPHQFLSSESSADPRVSRGFTLSIVIPAKNEAENLAPLVEEIVDAFRPLVDRATGPHRLDQFEIVVVNDGSTDRTEIVLDALRSAIPELSPLTLTRNVGQSAATIAGFRASRGDWVGLIDADLQNPPAELARLWDALPGYDAALGWRASRQDCRSKRWISRLANAVRNWVLGQSIKDTGCSVRIFPREVALRLPAFQGMHRFLGTLLLRDGCRVVQVPVSHRPRAHGKSHYHFGNRSIWVVVDLLGVAWLLARPIRFEVRPADRSLRQEVKSIAKFRKEER